MMQIFLRGLFQFFLEFCFVLLSRISTITIAMHFAPLCSVSQLFGCFFLQIPHSLFKVEGYDHRVALFGIPPYGGSIAQYVYYADGNLCDQNVDTSRGFPERDKDKDGKMLPWPTPYILMVDRGGCTFVQKV
mgnify:CR=1 FL=1